MLQSEPEPVLGIPTCIIKSEIRTGKQQSTGITVLRFSKLTTPVTSNKRIEEFLNLIRNGIQNAVDFLNGQSKIGKASGDLCRTCYEEYYARVKQ